MKNHKENGHHNDVTNTNNEHGTNKYFSNQGCKDSSCNDKEKCHCGCDNCRRNEKCEGSSCNDKKCECNCDDCNCNGKPERHCCD